MGWTLLVALRDKWTAALAKLTPTQHALCRSARLARFLPIATPQHPAQAFISRLLLLLLLHLLPLLLLQLLPLLLEYALRERV